MKSKQLQSEKFNDRILEQERLLKCEVKYIGILESELERVQLQMNQAKEIYEDLNSIKINPLSELRKLQEKTLMDIMTKAYKQHVEKM